MRLLISIAAVTLLSGCVVDTPPDLETSEAPAPDPTPSPSPTPSPTPTPTPAPSSNLDDGKMVIVLEGDSITAPSGSYAYSGHFMELNPSYETHNLAVGGSMLQQVNSRQETALALNPDILTIFIGANDFGTDAAGYAEQVFAYAEPFRANGTRVLVGTILPVAEGGVVIVGSARNDARREYAQIMEDAVGQRIDGVFDFGRHPVVGTDSAAGNTILYSDGIHPTGRNGSTAGQDYLYEAFAPVIAKAVEDVEKQYE